MSWLPISSGGMPPTSVQALILPVTAEPVEEIIENLDETVVDNSLAPDLIVCGLDTGGEVFFQPPDVPEPPEVLEYDAMTMKSAEMPSDKDDEVRFATAESDIKLSASNLIDLVLLQPLPDSGNINFSGS